MHDDKKIVFGDDNDSHIEYDTGGIDDYLVISGSSAGLVLSGTNVIIEGTLQGASPLILSGGIILSCNVEIATTGSQSISGSQIITGSLIVTMTKGRVTHDLHRGYRIIFLKRGHQH